MDRQVLNGTPGVIRSKKSSDDRSKEAPWRPHSDRWREARTPRRWNERNDGPATGAGFFLSRGNCTVPILLSQRPPSADAPGVDHFRVVAAGDYNQSPTIPVKILANKSFQKSTHDLNSNSKNQFICVSFSNPYVPERTCPQRSMRVSVFSLLNGLIVHSPVTILLEPGGCQGESGGLLLVIGISASFLKYPPNLE